jgi:hypothetical protein
MNWVALSGKSPKSRAKTEQFAEECESEIGENGRPKMTIIRHCAGMIVRLEERLEWT